MSKNVADFSQVFKEINKLGKNLEKAVVDAVNEGADYSARVLRTKVPFYKAKKSKNVAKYKGTIHRQYDMYHAKHHVVVGKIDKKTYTAEVGFDSDVAWRMHFVEYGTIKQKPQPFMRSTIESVENKVRDIIINKLRGVIK